MKEFKLHPKSTFSLTTPLEELVEMSEFWISELEFYGFEISYLEKTINKYFILLTKQEHFNEVQDMAAELVIFEKLQEELLGKTKNHLFELGLAIEKAFYGNEQRVRDEHLILDNEIALFSRDLKRTKKSIFGITKHVIESDKLQHLLTVKDGGDNI